MGCQYGGSKWVQESFAQPLHHKLAVFCQGDTAGLGLGVMGLCCEEGGLQERGGLKPEGIGFLFSRYLWEFMAFKKTANELLHRVAATL